MIIMRVENNDHNAASNLKSVTLWLREAILNMASLKRVSILFIARYYGNKFTTIVIQICEQTARYDRTSQYTVHYSVVVTSVALL